MFREYSFYEISGSKGVYKKVPFYASYYLEKQIPVHHDRSVEEDVYMEIIQNLSQFPEHLRMMFYISGVWDSGSVRSAP